MTTVTTSIKTKTFQKYDTETAVKHAWYMVCLMHNGCIGLKYRCLKILCLTISGKSVVV